MKICPRCGKQENEDNKFCRFCGQAFPEADLARKAALQGQTLEQTVIPTTEKIEKIKEKPKKSGGKKLKVAVVLVLILAVLGTAAYFALSYYFSPGQRLQRALDAGNWDEAAKIVKEDISLRSNEALHDELNARIEEVEAAYIAGTSEYETALQELAEIEEFEAENLAEAIVQARRRMGKLNTSRKAYIEGEALLAAGDYLDSIEWFKQVIEEDSNYSAAQNKIVEAQDGYRAETLSNAAQLAENKDYLSAMSVLDRYTQENGENADVTNAWNNYQDAYKQQILSNAAAYAAKQDYLSAIDTIEKAKESIGEDAELNAKAKAYENAYAEDISSQVNDLLADNKIEAAKTLLREAAKKAPGNEIIRTLQEKLNMYKTVSLSSLTPVNGGFTWNDGDPEDPFDNSYLNLQNYVIFHSGYSSWDGHGAKTETYSAEYQVNKQYDSLNFVVVPYSEFGQDGWSYIRIYADNVLRYTSDKVTQKTQPYNVSVDISDATYIKIIVYTDKFSCTMLTDVMLSKSPNFSSTRVQGYTSLSILDEFNGSLDWENDYPYDTLKTSYNNVNNYAVLHAGYSSWDGHGGKSIQYSAEYYTNKKYSAISLDIAPFGDFGANGSANIKIYADDILIYTSPTIVQKTQRFNTGEIDISQASYIKIVAEIDEYSCILISDVLLKDAK